VPFWAEEPKVGYKMINARAETVERLPAFREAYRKRRCLIPADGFFEWQAGAGPKAPKQPFLIRRPDRGPFVFAGLWETWRPKEGGEALVTCTIITTKANARLAPIHQRMPVILEPKDHAAWLDPANDGRPLLRPLADDWLETVPISPRINRPANDDPACIEPLDRPPGDPQASLF
jgi:putative SOS response-associated peptidase YedK